MTSGKIFKLIYTTVFLVSILILDVIECCSTTKAPTTDAPTKHQG